MSKEEQSKNPEEEGQSADDKAHFNLSVSADRDRFLRRTCPSCGLDFKTEIDPADLEWALSSQIRHFGLEIGEGPSSVASAPPPDKLRCPYCQHEADGREMHTAETIEYLKRFVYRNYMLPMVNKMFSGLEDSFGGGGGRGGGGLISISVSFKHERAPLPPRPIHGPEPADMKIVELLCCGRKIKVAERWTDVTLCTYCGAQVALI
jgi:hypothetical protein